MSSDVTSWILSAFWSDDRNTCLMICQCVLHGGSACGFESPMVLSSWIGGLAFEVWTLQVGCLVLVVSIGTFRSSDATLKITAPDFGVCCTSHFRKVGLNTQCGCGAVFVGRGWNPLSRNHISGRERKLVFKQISRSRRAWFGELGF